MVIVLVLRNRAYPFSLTSIPYYKWVLSETLRCWFAQVFQEQARTRGKWVDIALAQLEVHEGFRHKKHWTICMYTYTCSP